MIVSLICTDAVTKAKTRLVVFENGVYLMDWHFVLCRGKRYSDLESLVDKYIEHKQLNTEVAETLRSRLTCYTMLLETDLVHKEEGQGFYRITDDKLPGTFLPLKVMTKVWRFTPEALLY